MDGREMKAWPRQIVRDAVSPENIHESDYGLVVTVRPTRTGKAVSLRIQHFYNNLAKSSISQIHEKEEINIVIDQRVLPSSASQAQGKRPYAYTIQRLLFEADIAVEHKTKP